MGPAAYRRDSRAEKTGRKKSKVTLFRKNLKIPNPEEMVSTCITSMYFVAIFGVLIGASAGSCHAIIGGRELQRLSPTLVFH